MKTLAQRLYDAYNAGGDDPAFVNRNFKGDPCPAWADLPVNVRQKWGNASAESEAALEAVRAHLAACPFVVEGGDVRLKAGAGLPAAATWITELAELAGR